MEVKDVRIVIVIERGRSIKCWERERDREREVKSEKSKWKVKKASEKWKEFSLCTENSVQSERSNTFEIEKCVSLQKLSGGLLNTYYYFFILLVGGRMMSYIQ